MLVVLYQCEALRGLLVLLGRLNQLQKLAVQEGLLSQRNSFVIIITIIVALHIHRYENHSR